MTILVFDSVDKSGKSSVLENLGLPICNLPPAECFHRDYTQITFEHLQLIKKFAKKNKHFVINRYIPSEYAYSHTFNRRHSDSVIFMIDKELFKLKTLYVYCHAPLDIIEPLLKGRELELKRKHLLPELEKNYFEFFSKTVNPVLMLNTRTHTIEENIKIIKSMVKISR